MVGKNFGMKLKSNNMKYLITGVAGFIGFHLAKRLVEMNEIVIGIDNLNDYYDVSWKYINLSSINNMLFVNIL